MATVHARSRPLSKSGALSTGGDPSSKTITASETDPALAPVREKPPAESSTGIPMAPLTTSTMMPTATIRIAIALLSTICLAHALVIIELVRLGFLIAPPRRAHDRARGRAGAGVSEHGAAHRTSDRKSTRLNSSHPSI